MMKNHPIDFESGYLFESQKSISDRRAALGLNQASIKVSAYHGGDEPSSFAGGASSFLGSIIFALLIAAFWIWWQTLKALIAVIVMLLSRR